MALLLLVLITQVASPAEMSAVDRKLSSVPVPTNVTIEAYNLNAFVHWDYPVMRQTPVFIVEVKTYGQGAWSAACSTSDHQCNIFHLIGDPINSVWARVKARVGQEESAFAESKEFILCRQWKVGPPKLSIRKTEDQIIVDIFHPLASVHEQDLEEIYDGGRCDIFTYNVYVKVNGTLLILKEDDCNVTWCQLTVPVSSLTPEYCISAEGISDLELWPLKTEKSEELCSSIIGHKNVKNSVWIPIVAAVLIFLVLTLVIVCCNIKKINPFKRKSIMLPKSLVSVVKIASSETKAESKYISPITYEPIVPENEKVVSEEQWSPATISSTQTEDDPGKVEPKDLSSETEVVITEEHTSDVAPDSPLTPVRKADSAHSSGSNQSEPCSITLNAYHSRSGSDSGVVESVSFLSDSGSLPDNKTEVNMGEPEPIMLRNTTTSFGYDKPHVLVDLPVDEGGKESLIGYRVTAGSKEFS
ncbi:interferon gamma receptor 1 [Phyllostomus discolor]|uniref:Interferon gamma receptor 1 n=1 Tax=Phyllostomus discolor TaxID=89673 RepID=A0A6J2LGM4_9CHIR|nr:interferon gamma receptor 1 [Phyllostomus discolor]